MRLTITVLFMYALCLAGAGTVLVEDWEDGFIDETVWKHFGSPSSILYPGEGRNGSWGFDCNGDDWYGSGVCTHTDFDLSLFPWVRVWMKATSTHESWQYTTAGFSATSGTHWGGPDAQPYKLFHLSAMPAWDTYCLRYLIEGVQNHVEPWVDSLYNGIWMPYEERVNPWGTVSYLRCDTLRWESPQIYPEERNDQTFFIEGESVDCHQLVDDILLTFPALHDDMEDGMVPFRWNSWGEGAFQELLGGGMYGSSGISPGEGGLNGIASWQVFDLGARPFIWFSLIGSSTSSGHLQVGWSETDATGYGGDPPVVITGIHVEPSQGTIEYSLAGEVMSEPWVGSMNGQWQQFTLRINEDSTVSFFRNDTLRFTSSSVLNISSYDCQALVLQGESYSQLPVLDELFVYPSMPVPTSFITPLNGICTWDGCNGWAVGDEGRLLETHSFGESWEMVALDTQNGLNAVEARSAQHAWAVGDAGSVLITLDGNEWFEKSTGYQQDLHEVSFVSGMTGWAAGEDLLIRTDNAGFNWESQYHPITGPITGLSAVSPTHAWICGENGQLASTSDGENWDLLEPVTSSDLNAVDFFDPLHGWAVGAGGTVAASFDGGFSWSVQDTPVTEDLSDVSFFDGECGFAVGSSGTVLYTSSGGAVWEVIDACGFESCDFTGVSTYGQTVAWACGDKGLVLLGDFYSGGAENDVFHGLSIVTSANPIPSGGPIELTVAMPETGTAEISVFDIAGRQLYSSGAILLNEGTNSVLIERQGVFEDMPGGVYFLRCAFQGGSAAGSFVLLR